MNGVERARRILSSTCPWAVALTLTLAPSVRASEVGANDFRISKMGPDGNPDAVAFGPAVAYNPVAREYLVVWLGDRDDGEGFQVFGQRIDAALGIRIGADDFGIGLVGEIDDGDPFVPFPAVAYNSTDNEFLVAWAGPGAGGLQVYTQRIAATPVGQDDFQVSETAVDASLPPGLAGAPPGPPAVAVAYNRADNHYLVVWTAAGALGSEIHGQVLDGATGCPVEPTARQPERGCPALDNVTISDMAATDGGAFLPAVAHDGATGYLVAWAGDDSSRPGMLDDEFEIFGQRLDAAGQAIGDDLRLSHQGPDLDDRFDAFWPSVAYDGVSGQYLVVWEGDDDSLSQEDEELEIFGQRLTAEGVEIGDAFRLSDLGPAGTRDRDFDAVRPAVVWSNVAEEFLVVWQGDDNGGGLVDDEFEIFGQRLSAAGVEIGDDDFRLSDAGSDDGDDRFDASWPAVAIDDDRSEYLVAWSADDDRRALVDGELEVYGQRWVSRINDLRIEKSVSPEGAVGPGDPLTYTLTVFSDGPSDAVEVVVTDQLPPGLNVVSTALGSGWDLVFADGFESGDLSAWGAAMDPCIESDLLLTCIPGALRSGAEASLVVETAVDLQAVGPITNVANVTAGGLDPDADNNSASVETEIEPGLADVSVSVSDAPDPVIVDTLLTYTLTVHNAGPAAAVGVMVSDFLPPEVSSPTVVEPAEGCTAAAGLVTCDLGNLAAGAVVVEITAVPEALGIITNQAQASADGPDPDTGNDTDFTDTTVVVGGPADLGIAITDDPDPVAVGGLLTYTLRVDNGGPAAAAEVVVSNLLPPEVSFPTIVTPAEGCTLAGDLVTCDLGFLPAGDAAAVVITAVPQAQGVITNQAQVSAANPDPAGADNSASADTTVTQEGDADLRLTITDAPDPVAVGEVLTYSVTVINDGPGTASGVTLFDPLPPWLSSLTAGGCAVEANEVTCDLGLVFAGTPVTVTIRGTVDADAPPALTNTAVVGGDQDPDLLNNTATETTTVTQ